jgi:hypothetical protein
MSNYISKLRKKYNSYRSTPTRTRLDLTGYLNISQRDPPVFWDDKDVLVSKRSALYTVVNKKSPDYTILDNSLLHYLKISLLERDRTHSEFTKIFLQYKTLDEDDERLLINIIKFSRNIDTVVLIEVKLSDKIIEILKTLNLSNIKRFIIRVNNLDDWIIICDLLFMIEDMSNIELLGFSGFTINSINYDYTENMNNYTTNFTKLFTKILSQKKLRFLKFCDNKIDISVYNNIFSTAEQGKFEDDIMKIPSKRRMIKIYTMGCVSTKKDEILTIYKNRRVINETSSAMQNTKRSGGNKKVSKVLLKESKARIKKNKGNCKKVIIKTLK